MPRLRVRRRGTAEERAELAGYAAAAVAEVEAALDVPPDPSAAAFFDVDNTMIMGASLYYFAKGLAARNYFTSRDVASFIWQQAKFRIAGTENPDDVVAIRDNALAFVAGRTVAEIVEAGEEIYEESMADRIWTGTRALAQQHLDSGQRVWLITATPIELAALISARLGLTGALGTVSEIQEGVYTGRLVGEPMHGEAKAVAIRALAEREGLDLQRCAAYSDSANDVPMLSMVGRPIAVNPDSELKAIARARGWEVRDFRSGRKAARVGLPTALGLGMAAGAVAGAIAVRRRYRG